MSEAKHTPGSWEVDPMADSIVRESSGERRGVAVASFRHRSDLELAANARLIAEAPAMFEVLQGLANGDDVAACIEGAREIVYCIEAAS